MTNRVARHIVIYFAPSNDISLSLFVAPLHPTAVTLTLTYTYTLAHDACPHSYSLTLTHSRPHSHCGTFKVVPRQPKLRHQISSISTTLMGCHAMPCRSVAAARSLVILFMYAAGAIVPRSELTHFSWLVFVLFPLELPNFGLRACSSTCVRTQIPLFCQTIFWHNPRRSRH